ncbi:hypothetical protein [Leptolyngbya phage Lbo-JY46]
MKIRIIGLPKAQIGMEEQEVPLAELEQGEIYESTQGTINKISDQGNTHEEGGEIVDDAKRVLEDTSDKRKDFISKNLKLSPQEIEEATGVKVDKPMTHSKAFEKVTDYYNKKAKKISNKLEKNMKAIKGWDDYYANNSLDVNLTQLNNIPTDQDIFDTLFDIQESKKEVMGVGNQTMVGQYGLSNDPTTLKIRKDAEAAETEYDKLMRIRAEAEAAEAEYDNMLTQEEGSYSPQPQKSSRFNEDLNWFDVAGDLMTVMGANRRAPMQSYDIQTSQYIPRTVSVEPYLQRSQSDFNAALSTMGNSGSSNANRANLFALKRQADNQAIGQVEAMNIQSQNDAAMREAQRRATQSEIDARVRQDFDGRFLGSLEAQRLQKLTGWDSLFSKMAQNKKLNREGDLIMQMYNYFDQFGRYNGQQRNFTGPNPLLGVMEGGSDGINKYAIADPYNMNPAYIYTKKDRRGNERKVYQANPPRQTQTFRSRIR